MDSIKRQGVREALADKDLAMDTDEKIGKRSNEVIAERNGMKMCIRDRCDIAAFPPGQPGGQCGILQIMGKIEVWVRRFYA